MKAKKHKDADPTSTLITLDQLSQTIEVMTNVVNRLREHLSEQVLQRSETNVKGGEIKSEKELPTLKETKKSIDIVAQELSEKIQKINAKNIIIEIRNENQTNKKDDPTTLH